MSKSPQSKKPLDAKAGSAGQNSTVHAATSLQSSVTPEDYPVAEREGQTVVVGTKNTAPATGKGAAKRD